ncbi:MAG: PAS domain-containing protein, partial [Ginsengibacter sp.]
LILYLFDSPSISQRQKKIALVFSCIVLLIGALSLSYYAFGWDIGINDLFRKLKPEDTVDSFSGKMSLIVSFNFTLLGTIFLLLGKRKYHLLIQVLLIAIIPGSLVVILNNLFGISFLTSIPLRAPTSMLTAILFLIICVGVFISPALGYVQFSFVKKIAVFFVLIILVRGTVFFAINRNNQLAADKDKWVEHNHEVLLLAEKINAQSNDIQSGTRGYIITGEENFPIVLRQNADSINKIIDHLRLITKENADQQFTLDSLEKNLKTFIASQNELVTIQRNEGFEATRKIILKGEGISSLHKVHSLVAAIEQEENQILARHKAQNELIVQNSSRLFTLFQVIAILLMLIAFRIIYNHVRLRNKIEEALKISLKETSDYKYALNESSIVDITDQKGIIKQVNDNFCKISKYEREELIGQDHRLANANWHSKEFIENLWERIANGYVWRGEIKNKAKDGAYYWMDTTIIPFLNESGKPYQYIAIRSDITQRKNLANEILQMNDRLQIMVEEKTREIIEKEQQYRFLLENMREGIHLIGFDWKYLFVNSSAVEHGKYGDGEILGHTIMEKYPGIEKTNLFNILQNCMKNRYSEVAENEIVFPDGTKRWLELSIQPVPEGLFILSMDIGERKKVEHQLQESEHLLNDSQQVSKIGSYVLDFSKGLWKASRELDNIFGLESDNEHTVEDWISVIHPDDRVMMQEYFNNEVITKKQRFDKEYKIINKKTKKERSMHGIGDLEFDAGGTIVRMLGTIQD